MPSLPFDNLFQHKLLSLVRDGGITAASIDITCFQNPILAEICSALGTLQEQKIFPITKRMLYNQALKSRMFRDKEYQEDLKDSLDLMYKPCKDSEKLYIVRSLRDFNRLQTYKQALLRAEELLQDPDDGTLRQLDDIFAGQLVVESLDDSMGDFYFSGLIERLKERRKQPDVIRSLIPPLDKCLDDGGFAAEEINLFVGLPSAGKSFALLHMAKSAIVQKKKVLMISLEMTTGKLASRLDAAYAGVRAHELREHSAVLQAKLKTYYQRFGDALLLKKMPAGQTSVQDIRNHIHTLHLRGFKPDVLILDYMNLMAPARRSREGRHRDLGQVYIDLKGLIQDHHMWLFTAAQSNREGNNVKVITMGNLADSFEGSMHADVVISLNRSDEEASRERIRLYLAKDKNGVDKKVIDGSTNYARGVFWRSTHASDGEPGTETGEDKGSESSEEPGQSTRKKTLLTYKRKSA